MEINVGTTDRYVRFVVGAALVVVAALEPLGYLALAVGPVPGLAVAGILALLGVVLLVTGYTRSCLLYRPFGIDTARGTRRTDDEPTERLG